MVKKPNMHRKTKNDAQKALIAIRLQQGKSYRKIQEELHCSPKTISTVAQTSAHDGTWKRKGLTHKTDPTKTKKARWYDRKGVKIPKELKRKFQAENE
jgi:transposase